MTPATPAPTPAAPPPSLDDVEELFKAYADPIRLRLLNALAAGELCVCDLQDILGLPQSTVSRHLGHLRRAGLVEMTREWRNAHYRLAKPRGPIHRNLIACVRSCFLGIGSLDEERTRAEERVRERETDPCP